MWAYKFTDSRGNDYYEFPFEISSSTFLNSNEYQIVNTEREAVKEFKKAIDFNIPYKAHYEDMQKLNKELAKLYLKKYPEIFI